MKRYWLAAAMILLTVPAIAHDDGRFANSDLKPWFDRLSSGKGLCCSFADGVKVEDVDWRADGKNYDVRVCVPPPSDGDWVHCKKDWVKVPEDALITEPNKFGPAVVWPYIVGVQTFIRCFIPGSGA